MRDRRESSPTSGLGLNRLHVYLKPRLEPNPAPTRVLRSDAAIGTNSNKLTADKHKKTNVGIAAITHNASNQ